MVKCFLFYLYWPAHGLACTHANCSDDDNEHNRRRKCPTAPTCSKSVSVYRWIRHAPVCLLLPAVRVPEDTCTLPCIEQLSCWNSHTGLWRFKSFTIFFVALVFRDARNSFSHITSLFIFSDHSSHWLFQLQVLTYVNMAPVWVTMKWGRWN